MPWGRRYKRRPSARGRSAETPGPKQATVVALTRKDSGKTVEVRLGDRIVLRLPENPTTGFVWKIDEPNGEVLRVQSSDYSLRPGVGAGGGERSLVLESISPGTVTLQLKHSRDCESDPSSDDRFTATIRVMPGTGLGNAQKA